MRIMGKRNLVWLVAVCLVLMLLAGCEKKEKLPERGTETEAETESVEDFEPDRHSLYEGSTNYFYDQLSKEQQVFFNVLKKQAEKFYWGTEEPVVKVLPGGSVLKYFEGTYTTSQETTQGYFGNLELGPLSAMDAENVAQLFYHSCPKYFFFSGNLVQEDGKYHMELLDGFTSREMIDSYRDKIEEKTQEWMKVIENCGNDLEKEEAILQLIYDNVEYDSSMRINFLRHGITGGIGGALVDGVATDHGYAKTFQYLCNAAGLDSLYVWATSRSYHAWNMVNLYDEWYCIDVSWLDTYKMETAADRCFNKSYNSFKKQSDSGLQIMNGRYGQYGVTMPQSVRDTVKDGPELYSVQDEDGRYVIEHGLLTEFQGEGDVVIPAKAMEIDVPLFIGERVIRSFSVEEGSKYLCAEDGVLFDADKERLIRYPNDGAEEYVVPEGTKILAKMAFANCAKLKTLYLPASITEIRNYVFVGCDSLKDVYFDGTQEQWDAIENHFYYIPENCTIHFQ
ncbi:MAG: leucine-rich repeat protein [Lachnospiraceae bacterium]|nr:leucine-rich repeat protein [Lachnospiraceae bacterium]